jgi:hypothetical protein
MKWIALIALLFSAPAFAEHYIPAEGDALSIYMFCTSVAEVQVYALEGEPEPIPDEIDCWFAASPTMGLFNGEILGTVETENGDLIHIHEMSPNYFLNSLGILEPFNEYDKEGNATPRPVFIGVRQHGKGS